MALPSSGPLSFSQIGAALCTPQSAPYSLRSMSSAAGFSTPDSVSEFYGYSCDSCSISGTNVASPSATYVSGTVYITGTKTVRFSTFGGASPGAFTNSYLVLTGSGNYSQNPTRNQTQTTDITLTTGTYPFTLELLSYSGTSGNNASINCL